jgi:hypothetical protein
VEDIPVEGEGPPPELAGPVGIDGVGVVIGAVLTFELGGGVFTLAPVVLPEAGAGGVGGIGGVTEEEAMHAFLVSSHAYPFEQGLLAMPSQAENPDRAKTITSRSATEQLTYL